MLVLVVEDKPVYNGPAALEIPPVDLSMPLVYDAVKILGIEKLYGCLVSSVDPKVSTDMFKDVRVLTPIR